MTDEKELKSLIRRWYGRAKPGTVTNNDPFDLFICLWIAFNAWGVHETRIETHDTEMIKALKTNPKLEEAFNRCRDRTDFQEMLLNLKGHKIPTHKESPRFVCLENVTSLPQLLSVLYQIRCNLFHGRKDPEAADEVRLVKRGIFILDTMFDVIMHRGDFP